MKLASLVFLGILMIAYAKSATIEVILESEVENKAETGASRSLLNETIVKNQTNSSLNATHEKRHSHEFAQFPNMADEVQHVETKTDAKRQVFFAAPGMQSFVQPLPMGTFGSMRAFGPSGFGRGFGGFDRGFNRGFERGFGHDRGFGRGFGHDRGFERGFGHDRGFGRGDHDHEHHHGKRGTTADSIETNQQEKTDVKRQVVVVPTVVRPVIVPVIGRTIVRPLPVVPLVRPFGPGRVFIGKRESENETENDDYLLNNPEIIEEAETTTLEAKIPDITTPEPTIPDTTTPEPTIPDTTTPEPTIPDTTTPEPTIPEETVTPEIIQKSTPESTENKVEVKRQAFFAAPGMQSFVQPSPIGTFGSMRAFGPGFGPGFGPSFGSGFGTGFGSGFGRGFNSEFGLNFGRGFGRNQFVGQGFGRDRGFDEGFGRDRGFDRDEGRRSFGRDEDRRSFGRDEDRRSFGRDEDRSFDREEGRRNVFGGDRRRHQDKRETTNESIETKQQEKTDVKRQVVFVPTVVRPVIVPVIGRTFVRPLPVVPLVRPFGPGRVFIGKRESENETVSTAPETNTETDEDDVEIEKEARTMTVSNLKIQYPIRAVSFLFGCEPNTEGRKHIFGRVDFFQLSEESKVEIKVNITFQLPSPKKMHGLHVHKSGINADDKNTTIRCGSTGPHFNPFNVAHGVPGSPVHHTGDLGNVQRTEDGMFILTQINDTDVKLAGVLSIVGRALVLHQDMDDGGETAHPLSALTGNAGARIACGDIVLL